MDQGVPPSKRITVGIIGIGAMGSGHVRRVAGDPGFRVLAVCDVDRVRRENAQETVNGMYAAERSSGSYHGCAAYNDYREVLARPDIDAVVIATPDHWHSLQSIDAAKAGKDIYCEKPISVTIEESRRVVETVRRYGRVFQTGTQYRSIPTIRQVCQFVRNGGLGQVKTVFTLLNNLSGWIRSDRFKPYAKVMSADICGRSYVPLDFPLPAEPVPEGLDWNLWVGPAPWHPYNHAYHTNPSPGVVPWSFCDAFGVTSSTWFLSHAADIIQYALGMENSGPVELVYPDDGEYPTLTFKYANGTLLHFVDHWGMVKDTYKAVPASARLAGNFGGIFVGERGWVTTLSTGGPIEGGPEELMKEMGLKTREVNIGANNHHANWLECIHSRRSPSSNEEIGHRSATIGHLTNIVFWTGRSLKWDPAAEQFIENAAANRLRSRASRAPWRV
ncbi:MAG: Gfo/Idh/MocA family oxidoreductase [Candidatus Omnitrophica bacterium]|nr:Gfo/Idh/MocA family oxidoreductase [Candidatus Omnitrophota bacterium]